MRAGCGVVVLSDKGAMQELSPPIPPLLATGAVHHHLIKAGERLELVWHGWAAPCCTLQHVLHKHCVSRRAAPPVCLPRLPGNASPVHPPPSPAALPTLP